MAKKLIFIFFVAPLIMLAAIAPSVSAHCPLCTAAVGAAALSAKYFGVDVSIIGLLIGAFAVSTGLWVALKVKRYFKFQTALIVLVSFFLTVIPLRAIGGESLYMPMLWFGASGTMFNKVYWVDKLLLGSVLGGIITLFSYWLHLHIKKVHGKVIVPFQGIILTVGLLVLSSTVMFFYFR